MEAQNKHTEDEQNELSLENIRALLGENGNDSDEELKEVISGIKVFCKVAYELYAQHQPHESNIVSLELPLKQVA